MMRLKAVLSRVAVMFVVLCSVLTFSGGTASAVDLIDPVCKATTNGANTTICKDNKSTQESETNPIFGPGSILATVINVLSMIAAIIAVFVILIAGVKMITASGDANSIGSARRTVLYAVISLAIVGVSQIAVRFILSKL